MYIKVTQALFLALVCIQIINANPADPKADCVGTWFMKLDKTACKCGYYTGTHCGNRKDKPGDIVDLGAVLTGNCYPNAYYHCKDAFAPAQLKSYCTGPNGCVAKSKLGDDNCGTAF
ncbi:unnamed protein product [Oppiella nova]|uniref:Uncharacterized protein n=1 Tax=Oppiella nova TaxID=334625 RepID=A0A7R9MB60_9ACAR|nr:unnamed protein product [Oppiella nova]CAG2173625.1 unnamed protein product [Oppiella nova]